MPLLNIGPLDLLALLAIGIMLMGPDKLPGAVQSFARLLRQFRDFTRNAQNELKKELGPEFQDLDLADLHPKNFVRKQLMGPDGVGLSADDLGMRELRDATDSLNGEIRGAGSGLSQYAGDVKTSDSPAPRSAAPRLTAGERPPYDADAT
jgi:sec-independent protein translocase protein TatB